MRRRVDVWVNRERCQEYVDAVMAKIPVSDYDIGVAFDHAELLAAVREARRPRGAHDPKLFSYEEKGAGSRLG